MTVQRFEQAEQYGLEMTYKPFWLGDRMVSIEVVIESTQETIILTGAYLEQWLAWN